MPSPIRYQPSYSFTGWQAYNPSRPLPAQRVDIEFQNIQQSIDSIIANGTGGGSGGGSGGPIAISDVTGLQAALDGKASSAALAAKESTAYKGQAGGYASLGSDGKVPAAQLPTQAGGADAKAPVYFSKTDTLIDSKLFSRADQAADVHAQKLVETASPFNGNYAGGNISAFHVRHVAEGTEKNGPRGAALGASVSMFKEGFGTGTAKGGEIDGLYVVLRQDSPRTGTQGINDPSRGDGCGVLIDAAVHENVGFVGGIEGATIVLSNTQQNANGGGVPTRRLSYQIGCTDTTTAASIGYFASAAMGRHSAGIAVHAAENDGGYFDHFLQLRTDTVGIFNIDRNGVVSMGRRLNSGQMIDLSMHMTIQANYSLGWLNANRSTQLLNLDQNGNLTANGTVAGASLNTTGNIQAGGTVGGATVQASGNIIAGGGMKANYIDLVPGGDPGGTAGGPVGRLCVGPSGGLRYYDGSRSEAMRVSLTYP